MTPGEPHPASPTGGAEGARPPGHADEGWPSISFERHRWHVDEDAYVSKTQRRRVAGDYLAAVVPHIAGIGHIPLPPETRALAEDATAEIARFDGTLGDRIAPFTAVLLRSESAASSKIENLTASAKAIALAELGDPRGRNANLIVANTRAMEAAIALADALDGDALAAMQRTLLGRSTPDLAGRWRGEQVWIGGSNVGPHTADFVPPHHRRVPADIDDLVAFLRRTDLPVLAHAAVAHAQFGTIHPFPDGNGRTGRALIHALLRARGTTTNVTIPVSAGLLTDTAGYFDALTSYRAGDPAPIVTALAEATFAAIANGGRLVDDLEQIAADWRDRVAARSDSAAWRIVDHLLIQPAVSWSTLSEDLGLASASAYRAIDRLETAGVLSETSGKGWGRVWVAPEVLRALDDFAARAGRRDHSGRAPTS